MSIHIEAFENEAIVIGHFEEPFNASSDLGDLNEAVTEMLQTSDGIVYRIEDLTHIDVSFSALVEGLSVVTSKTHEGSARNERIRLLFAGHDQDLLEMLQSSFKQKQYGEIDVEIFETLDDALTYVREQ